MLQPVEWAGSKSLSDDRIGGFMGTKKVHYNSKGISELPKDKPVLCKIDTAGGNLFADARKEGAKVIKQEQPKYYEKRR